MAFGVAGTFNTGIDRTISIVDNATGASVSLGGRRTNITSDSKDRVIEGEGVDQGGLIDHVVIPGGVSGVITIDRQNGNLDRLKDFMDRTWYAGQGTRYYTITVTTYNQFDKSTDKEQLTNVVFHDYKGGDWKRDRVSVSIAFQAQQRKQIQ